MSGFTAKLNIARGRDIIGLLNAAQDLLERVELSPQNALTLSIRVANLCAGVEKTAQDMASRCSAKEPTGDG